jgi:hypothetical protein
MGVKGHFPNPDCLIPGVAGWFDFVGQAEHDGKEKNICQV